MLGVPADFYLLAYFPLFVGPHPVGGLLEGYQAAGVNRAILRLPSAGRDEILPLVDQWSKLVSRFARVRVRAAGGLCVAEEVQVGFGRMGTSFWGFEQSGVVPDIITIAKPMGNGFPIGGVITSKKVADALASQGALAQQSAPCTPHPASVRSSPAPSSPSRWRPSSTPRTPRSP